MYNMWVVKPRGASWRFAKDFGKVESRCMHAVQYNRPLAKTGCKHDDERDLSASTYL